MLLLRLVKTILDWIDSLLDFGVSIEVWICLACYFSDMSLVSIWSFVSFHKYNLASCAEKSKAVIKTPTKMKMICSYDFISNLVKSYVITYQSFEVERDIDRLLCVLFWFIAFSFSQLISVLTSWWWITV